MNKMMCAWLFVAIQVASAAAVDFEDLGIPLNTQTNPNPASVTSGGFRFDYGPLSTQNAWTHLHVGSETYWAYNGTTVLVPHYDVVFARTDSSLFSLSSLDLAGFPGAEATIQVIGTFPNSSTISTTFTLDGMVDGIGGAVDFQTFSLGAGWNNLSSVRIVNTDPGSNQGLFGVDNISVIPEPEICAMMIVALGLLGFAGRPRTQRATAGA